jgi:hypothetical protein
VDKESLADELEELSNQLLDLRKKIEAIDNIISGRKSIQSLLGFFGLILLLFFVTLAGGIILTTLLNMLDQYSEMFFIAIFVLATVWIVYFVGSRIIIKNISTNSILRDKLSKQLEETESEIDKMKLLIEKEEQTLKEPKTAPETRVQSLESKQTEKGNNKSSGSSAAVEQGTKKDEQIFEEEQKKKGLVKFVPVRLQIRELMAEEGHDEAFDSKISKKWKKPRDVPSEITWGTPEQVFEWTQKEKGYIKFVDGGKVRWGTEKQVAKWQKEKTEKTKD